VIWIKIYFENIKRGANMGLVRGAKRIFDLHHSLCVFESFQLLNEVPRVY
jgi:hypothetical protein